MAPADANPAGDAPRPESRRTTRMAVSLIGPDRPGIVAAISKVLLQFDCNVEDVATAILSGHFALTMVTAGPAILAYDDLVDELNTTAYSLSAQMAVWHISPHASSPAPTHSLTVYGPDQTGIVHAVSGVLAQQNVNICDMSCHLSITEDPVYTLAVELVIPVEVPAGQIADALGDVLRPRGLELSLHEITVAAL